MEVTNDVMVDTSAPAAETAVTPEPIIEAPRELSTKEAIEQQAEKANAPQSQRGADGKFKGKGQEALIPAPVFEPSLKYKVMDKEHEIPPEFKALMKDADSEKKIREIFEKSTGLDTVKENLATARTDRDNARKQHAELNGQINEMRSTYQSAVQSGDMHKLDQLWKKLEIPQDVIMQYALEKVKLHEMAPEQRNALVAKQNAETQAETIRRQQAETSQVMQAQQSQMKQMMLEVAYNRPENIAAAEDFDNRLGKPGMFKETVRQWGEQEWFRSQGRVDLTPDQAVAAVIKHFGLATAAKTETATPAVSAPNQDPRKNVIVKPANTIPNLGSGGSQSPLKSKPKNLEELKTLAARSARGEAV